MFAIPDSRGPTVATKQLPVTRPATPAKLERMGKTGRSIGRRQMKPLADRLAAKTGPPDTRGCLIFTGFRDRRGYGFIGQGRAGLRPVLAHRAAWEVAKGAIPPGMHVLH